MTDSAAQDEALSRLIEMAGIDRKPEDLRALLAGINASPIAGRPDRWMALIAPDADAALAERFDQVRRALATAARGVSDRAERLAALRTDLARQGLAGFIVPRADEHQGESVPPYAERLAWLTGFTGSAGLAIVLRDTAALFVDGRYTLQAAEEVDGALYTVRHLMDEPHAEWVAAHLNSGDRFGYDPRLHTIAWAEKTATALERRGASLVPVAGNPIDAVWEDQPPPPLAPVVPHDIAYAGESAADKQAAVAKALAGDGLDAAVLTAPDSIAWLLNIRGADVPNTPLALSYAIVTADADVQLFIDRRKLTRDTAAHLGNRVTVEPPDAFGPAMDALGAAGKTVLVDASSAGAWIFHRLDDAGASIRRDRDPCLLPKARKNPVELEGARAAHRRDGAAMARFLAWVAAQGPAGGLTESGAADALARIRAEDPLFRDLSFETISGAGSNGAIVHYRVSERTDRALTPGTLYLVDSGAQYLDGTTDVTRTVAIGTPTAEMCRRYTLVLKGHIALATARFPKGTTGSQLDVLARQFLWQAGLDYDHGTGHGVGSFLGVHEGPHRISKMPNSVALEPGMIVSNEPGYYKTGAYGIRFENLVAVRESPAGPDEDKPMLAFETVTLVPADPALIVTDMLTAAERAWIDAYHDQVRRALAPRLDVADKDWLDRVTAPIGKA
ncbi:MAG: aminopeptidase P family protein [Inquilinaceae bacterium]